MILSFLDLNINDLTLLFSLFINILSKIKLRNNDKKLTKLLFKFLN